MLVLLICRHPARADCVPTHHHSRCVRLLILGLLLCLCSLAVAFMIGVCRATGSGGPRSHQDSLFRYAVRELCRERGSFCEHWSSLRFLFASRCSRSELSAGALGPRPAGQLGRSPFGYFHTQTLSLSRLISLHLCCKLGVSMLQAASSSGWALRVSSTTGPLSPLWTSPPARSTLSSRSRFPPSNFDCCLVGVLTFRFAVCV